MTWFGRSIITLLILVVAMISNVSANDWNVASGGVSEDEVSRIVYAAGTGIIPTGATTTSIRITVGTGDDFFTSGDVIAPNIDIYASTASIAQVAAVLGGILPQTFYHDPDSFLSPWLDYPVDIYLSGSKNFELFSLDANVIAGVISGDEAIKSFGLFVRILDRNRIVLDEASFNGYIIDGSVTPVPAPW